MSIQNIQNSTQNSELYQIHKKTESQNTEQLQAQQAVQEIPQSDEYDTANPVGEEVEGIYSVSYDDDGNLQVNYTQPGRKADSKTGGAAPVSGTEESEESSNVEEEIEKLKKQRNQIKQQLNKEKDEDVKKALRTQLQMIEAQIAQLSSQQKS